MMEKLVEPMALMVVLKLASITPTAVTDAITENTPMIIPKRVRAERNLFAMIAPHAILINSVFTSKIT